MKTKSFTKLVVLIPLMLAAGCGPKPSPSEEAAEVSAPVPAVVQQLVAMKDARPFSTGEMTNYGNETPRPRCQVSVAVDPRVRRISLIGQSDNDSNHCPNDLLGPRAITFECHDDASCTNASDYGGTFLTQAYKLLLLDSNTFVLISSRQDRKSATAPAEVTEYHFQRPKDGAR